MNKAVLIVSFIFLANPAIHVIDLLPDFFGWLLLLYFIRKSKFLSVQTEYAYSYIKKMTILSAASFASVFIVPISDGTMLLTITFVISVLKLIWGIPAFKYFYNGIGELGALYGAKSIYKPLCRDKNEGIRTAENFTVLFYVLSTVLNVLPEFAELTETSSEIYSDGYRSILSFKSVIYMATVSVTVIVALIWLAVMVKFINNLCSERELFARLDEAYDDKIVKTFKHRAIKLNNAIFIKTLSGLFVFCIISNSFNRIPTFLFGILTLISSLILLRNGYKSKPLIITSAASAFVSALNYVLSLIFLSKYSISDVAHSFEAYDLWTRNELTLVISILLMIVVELCWFKQFGIIAREHSLREVLVIDNEKYNEQRSNDIKEMRRNNTVSFVMFAVVNILSFFAFKLTESFTSAWLIVFVFDLIWFFYTDGIYSKTRAGIEKRYF